MTTSELTIREPDDWHLHLRDGALLRAVLPHTTADFARAIVMPNLVPPVVTCSDAQRYLETIVKNIPAGDRFEPLMTLYMTETTDPAEVETGAKSGLIKGVKLYPAGATTNSDSGVRDVEKIYPVLERMSEIGLPLLVHGEVVDAGVDIFDREAVFIDRVLEPLRVRFPELRVVLEHLTTEQAVEYVKSSPGAIGATITTHHLIINRNAILAGGIRPHYYCLPVAKRERHRRALVAAATSGDARFFLGTDSAPHLDSAKIAACGCAGCYTAINALSCVAQVFENEDALEHLEAFVSLSGPAFYGLPANDTRIRLVRSETPVEYPASVPVDGAEVTVFDPGFPLYWTRAD
ncbi:MAG: dihydroorotase [Woeseiaceae bacterium]